MISTYSSPLFLAEGIQHILDTEELDLRTRLALEDVQSDLEAMQEFMKTLDKWEKGNYTTQTLIAAYNIYVSARGYTRLRG
jgi:hypothetical protein